MRNPNKKFFCSEKKEYKQVEVEKEYSMYQLSKHDLLRTGATSFQSCRNAVRKIIHNDRAFENILQANMSKDDSGKVRYSIKGSNIARYLMKKGQSS